MIRLSQSLVTLQHNAPVHVEFSCIQSPMIVGVDVRVSSISQPAGVIVYAQRLICSIVNIIHRHTVRIHLPNYLAYCPAADNRYSVYVDNATIDAWVLDPAAYADARAYSKFYDVATEHDRRVVGVTSPWQRPRRPDVTNLCHSWWESIRVQLPYQPVCHAELGLFMS